MADDSNITNPPGDNPGVDIVERLRETTQHMASKCSVDMILWDAHSNACLSAADEIERLREVLAAFSDAYEFDELDGWSASDGLEVTTEREDRHDGSFGGILMFCLKVGDFMRARKALSLARGDSQ
jgi:hypothetical protein